MTDPGPQHHDTPAIRVTGPASPEDVAVVVAVLAAASADGAGEDPPRGVSTWSSHEAAARRPLPHGRGAWRTTYRH